MFRHIIPALVLLLAVHAGAAAQTGIGTQTPNPAAQLDVSAANKGLLIPRVALLSDTSWSLDGSPTEGMMVFNTATAGSGTAIITPGFYYWFRNSWYAFAQATAIAPAGTANFACGDNVISSSLVTNGFVHGTSYTGFVTMPYTAGNGGSYPADGSTINGLTLVRSGSILANGSGQIIYSMSGTYSGATGSTESFMMNLPGNSCVVVLPQVASFNAGTLSCQAGTAATGLYVAGYPTDNTHGKSITVTPAAAGAYRIATDTVAGMSYSATGVFTGAQVGIAQTLLLQASGTPATAGLKTFTVRAGTQTCTFNVTVTSPAAFACANLTSTIPFSFTNGTTYSSGTVTLPYTSGSGNAYGAITLGPVDGLSLTRVAGTYTGTGSVIYNLSGTYTGVTGSAVAFTLPEAGCMVNAGPATFSAGTLACTGALAGSYYTVVPMTGANTKTMSVNVATRGTYSISTTANGVTFSAAGGLNTGNQSIVLTASGNATSSGTFTYTVILGGQTCSFNVTFPAAAAFNCGTLTNSLPRALVNGAAYTGTVTLPYTGGSGIAYPTMVLGPINGLTLTRTAGTYAAVGGNVIYSLSGTYTGATDSQAVFVLPENGCTVITGSALYTAASLSCSGTPAGAYRVNTPLSGANMKVMAVGVQAAGFYNAVTDTVNGISFAVSGFFSATGTQPFYLAGSGTPAALGTFTYTARLGGQTCTFNITSLPPATFNCSTLINALPPALDYGTAYTGTVTLPYTNGGGMAYSAAVIGPVNGLSLTRTAGTYAAGGGNVVYNLSGTYTGPADSNIVFTLPESGCSAATGRAAYVASALSCSGALAGTYRANTPLTAANTKAVSIGLQTAGSYSAVTDTVNGVSFAGTGLANTAGFQTLNLAGSGTPVNPGLFTYTVKAGGQTCTFSITYATAATFNCNSITHTLPATLTNNTAYTGTLTEPYTAGSGAAYAGAIAGPVNGLSLTRTAGTFAAGGGNVTYSLSGTYTGASGDYIVFTLPESGCTVGSGLATYAAGSLSCAGALAGNYQAGLPLTAAHTKTLGINVTATGGYAATTNTANGVSFTATGTFAATGVQNVVLTANGTPAVSGNFSYSVSLGGQTCSFTVTFGTAVTVACTAITNTLPGTLVNGTAYTGTVTEPYTAGNNSAYPAIGITIGGLTLTRVAGTYAAAGGNVRYNVTGTFTGITGIPLSFILPETSCAAVLGQLSYATGTLDCSGPLAGTYQAGLAMNTTTNKKTIMAEVLTAGGYSISSNLQNGMSFSASGNIGTTGTQSIVLAGSGIPIVPGTFTYTITFAGQTCSFPVTFLPAATFDCSSIVSSLPAAPVNGMAYTGTVTIPYTNGNGTAYSSTVLTSNGMSLTRAAGTYAVAGGNVTYNLSGTYTGATGGAMVFTLPESGCGVYSNATAVTAAGSLNCILPVNGSYISGLPMSSSNTKPISVYVSSGGGYTAGTDTVNGIFFAASGGLSVPGNQNVLLTASGTPLATGTFLFTATLDGQSCTFPITFQGEATFDCNSIAHTLPGTLVNGTAYTSTITEPYTGGSGGSYPAAAIGPFKGLTLTRSAGTYAGSGGNITYDVSGTYTGPTADTTTITLPESGCPIKLRQATFVPGSLSCSGPITGSYQISSPPPANGTKTISVNVATPGSYTVTTVQTASSGTFTFTGSGVFTTTGVQDIVLTAGGTVNSYPVATCTIALGGETCSFTVPTLSNYQFSCAGLTSTLPATLTNGVSYTGAVTIPYTQANGTGSFAAQTFTSNGLTLSHAAGAPSFGSGSVVYNLSGTYTGTTGALTSFVLSPVEGGCTVTAGGGPVYAAGSLSCSTGAVAGTYARGVAMSAANTKSVQINITNAGAYTVNTDTVNGVSFGRSGYFGSTGSQLIALTATGTPADTGTFTYTLSLGGQTCTFSIPFRNAAMDCANMAIALGAALTNGVVPAGSISLPYTSGSGAAYAATPIGPQGTPYGVVLNRVAGTYAAGGGTVSYTMSGTYSGPTGGTISFQLPEGCTVSVGTAKYAANSLNSSGPLAGTYKMGMPMTNANTKTITVRVTTPGTTGSLSTFPSVNGVTFSGTTILNAAGTGTIVLTAGGTPQSAGTFSYTLTVDGQTCIFPVTFLTAATFDCSAITSTLPGAIGSGLPYTGTVTEPFTLGNGAAYATTTLGPVTGLSLTRTAGTYTAGGGNVIYTLSGTSSTSGTAAFTLPESGCMVSAGPALYVYNTLNCGSVLTGSYRPGMAMTSANTKTINVTVATAGPCTITSSTGNGVTFTAGGNVTAGNRDIVLTASGTPLTTGTFVYTVSVSNGASTTTGYFTVNFH